MKYRHKEWIKKRSLVFKRDKKTCRACNSKQFLQCHHSYYLPGKELWEYPLNSLYTLCKKCHSKFHRSIKGSELVIRAGINKGEIEQIKHMILKNNVIINLSNRFP